MKRRNFKILDIDADLIIEETTKKDIMGFLSDYVDNLPYSWFDGSNDAFMILYDDNSEDYISEDYNGHKIKKQHIISIVYSNECTCMTYGNYSINECGVVIPSDTMDINSNIQEDTTT